MRLFTTTLCFLTLAWVSAAEQSMPTCASDCMATYLASSTCSSTDYTCICADATLIAEVEVCSATTCSILDTLTTMNVTDTLCGEPVRDITYITPIVSGVSMAFAILSVILRLLDSYARDSIVHWSNLCIVMALACSIVMGGLEFPMSALGFGKDVWTLPFDNVTKIVMYTWLTEVFYMAALGLTKMAILAFYLKVFPDKTFQKICWVTIVICAAYIPAFCLATIFHCTPVSYTWTSWTGETTGYCADFNAFAWAHAIINIILDLFIMTLPLPLLWKLNMGLKRKLFLMLMFSVGIFITVISIVRLSALVEFATTSNATYDNVPTAYWSVLEAFVSIICCCLPSLRSLFSKIFPNCFGSTNQSGSPHGNTPYTIGSKPKKSRNGIQKTLSATVTYEARTGDASSDVELVDRGINRGWAYTDSKV